MAKVQSPLLGYNTNIRHKGKVFHIQTEDSGIQKPHVMTHLFADGGRILKSQKTSYAHLLETEDLATQVKKLMQDQHKAMFLALREGQFDEVAGVAGPAGPAGPASLAPVDAAAPTGESNPISPAATPLTPSSPISRGAPPPPPPRSNLPPAPSVPVAPVATVVPVASVAPAAVASVVPAPVVSVVAPVASAGPSVAPARHAVFGDSLISERSLDEVILAFLAEELEESRAP